MPRRFLVLLFAAVAALGVGVSAEVADAHGDDGEMTVTSVEQSGPRQLFLGVGIKYTNDAELAQEAQVTAVGTGPDGATLPPVVLPRISGARYEALITVPSEGTWTFEVVSVEPKASATATVEIQAPAAPSSSAPPVTTAPATTTIAPTTATPTTTVAPTTTGTVDSSEEDDDPSGAPVLLLIAVVGVLALAGAFVFARSRRSRP